MLNTPSDRSGLVVIFVAVGVCWTLTVLVTRLSGSASRRRGLGWEDWGIVASTVGSSCKLSCGGRANLLTSASHAHRPLRYSQQSPLVWGRATACTTPPLQRLPSPPRPSCPGRSNGQQALYAADVLYIPALAFSKLATLQLITALSPARRHKRVCYALCAVTTLWAVAGVFAVAIRCDLSEPWDALTSQQCPDLVGPHQDHDGSDRRR